MTNGDEPGKRVHESRMSTESGMQQNRSDSAVSVMTLGSLNRAMRNDGSLRFISPRQIWLSQTGKKQAIALFETRLCETFKYPHTGTSVEYARIVELECRLLEKEWSSYPGKFDQMRLR
jgi:CRISPR-associated protein Cas1